jgi:hypothetical protein
MNKTVQILNTIIFLSGLFVEELAKEREESGKTDEEILADTGMEIEANDVLAVANLAKYQERK